jgi:hypothetical protein
MRFDGRAFFMSCLVATVSVTLSPRIVGAQQAGATPTRRVAQPPDPRVHQRTDRFADTNEDIPHAVFVSSKARADKTSPLISAS